ncbi:MAG: hypothetical protein K6T94_25855 [Paenibacillus sp.]|nr:hypothetical protein [Paenibacillus sp.]
MKHLISLFFTILMVGTLITGVANADWAYNVVVYDGNSYIPSDVQIDSKQIGTKIGKVTYYSDVEDTYSGNFSNKYPKDTEYYSIDNVDVKVAIAVKEDNNKFIIANYEGKYAGSKFSWRELSPFILVVPILGVIAYLINKRAYHRHP